MTSKRAKKETLELWEYIVQHPESDGKNHLPKSIFNKIKYYYRMCPLCEYNKSETGKAMCCNCILESCAAGSLFGRWCLSIKDEDSIKYAQAIIDKVKSWRV
jgi:hypothetical protein